MKSQRGSVSRVALLAACMVIATAASACGARWDSDQSEAVLARYNNDTDGRGNGQSGPSDGGTVSGNDVTRSTIAAGAGGTGSSGSAGTTGGSSGGTGEGPLPCAAPSTGPGLTNDKITVGTIGSISGPVPGLGASSAAAVRSYVAYLNANGGVCGRQVSLKEADDGTDSGRYRSLLTQLAGQTFGIVGGLAQGDIGGADVASQTKIPIVNSPTAADAMTVLPNAFDINPPFENLNTVIGKYRFLYESGVRKASFVYLAVEQSRAEAKVQQALMKAAGIQIVQVQELPVATLSYDSAARSVANSGADYVWFLAEASGNANFARSLKETGYKPKFVEYFVYGYGSNFIQLAGDAAEGATAWIRSLPVEDGPNANAELRKYIDWMDQVAPSDRKDLFAADGWASAKVFFDALAAIPGPITREALIAQLNKVESYDAGGMFGRVQFAKERSNGCVVGMQVKGGRWTRLAPSSGLLC